MPRSYLAHISLISRSYPAHISQGGVLAFLASPAGICALAACALMLALVAKAAWWQTPPCAEPIPSEVDREIAHYRQYQRSAVALALGMTVVALGGARRGQWG